MLQAPLLRRCIAFLHPSYFIDLLDTSKDLRQSIAASLIIEFFAGLANRRHRVATPVLPSTNTTASATHGTELSTPVVHWLASILGQYPAEEFAELFTASEWTDLLKRAFEPPHRSSWSSLHGPLVGWIGLVLQRMTGDWLLFETVGGSVEAQLREYCTNDDASDAFPIDDTSDALPAYDVQQHHLLLDTGLFCPATILRARMPGKCISATVVEGRIRWDEGAPDVAEGFLSKFTLQQIDLAGMASALSIETSVFAQSAELRMLELYPLCRVRTIENSFARRCTLLELVDMRGMRELQTIGDRFLAGCSNLRRLIMDGLTKLKSIGSDFLVQCVALEELQLDTLVSLTDIDTGFLQGCSSVQCVTLPPTLSRVGGAFLPGVAAHVDFAEPSCLSYVGPGFETGDPTSSDFDLADRGYFVRVERIGDGFMQNLGVVRLDMRGMQHLVCLGSAFMQGCNHLTEVNCSGWTNLREVEDDFLACLPALTKVDLRGWSSLVTVGDNFLGECPMLVALAWSEGTFSTCTSIGAGFFAGCAALEELPTDVVFNGASLGPNFLSQSGLKTVRIRGSLDGMGDDLCSGCVSLTAAVLPGGFDACLQLPESVFAGCVALTSLNTADCLSHVKFVGGHFLGGTALPSFDLSSVASIVHIGNAFVEYSTQLRVLDLRGASSLAQIDHGFASSSVALEVIDLRGLTALRRIGNEFAQCCRKLHTLHVAGCRSIQQLGREFCEGCVALQCIDDCTVLDRIPDKQDFSLDLTPFRTLA